MWSFMEQHSRYSTETQLIFRILKIICPQIQIVRKHVDLCVLIDINQKQYDKL